MIYFCVGVDKHRSLFKVKFKVSHLDELSKMLLQLLLLSSVAVSCYAQSASGNDTDSSSSTLDDDVCMNCKYSFTCSVSDVLLFFRYHQ